MPRTRAGIAFVRDNWETALGDGYWARDADEALYRLFSKRPPALNLLRSRVMLLGRGYLTNIEKKADVDKIARIIWADEGFRDLHRALEDNHLASARFAPDLDIYRTHVQICRLLRRATNTWESVFASKWLHFHAPAAFPILDRVVEENIEKHEGIAGRERELGQEYLQTFHPELQTDREDYDNRYCWYCFLLLKLRATIAERLGVASDSLTPRQLDLYVYDLV